jgi:hypothetical protein
MLKKSCLIVTVFACAALSQQTNERKHLTVPSASDTIPLRVSAMNVSREAKYPSSIRLSGNVEIVVPMCYRQASGQPLTCPTETVITGDSAVLREDTGEIEASGTVHVTPFRTIP